MDSVKNKIQKLQEKLSLNMDKAVILAEKNVVRNKKGQVTFKK